MASSPGSLPAHYLSIQPPDRPQIMYAAALFSLAVHALAIGLIDFAPPQTERPYTAPVINVDMALLQAIDEGNFDPWIEIGEQSAQFGDADERSAPDAALSQGRRGVSDDYSRGLDSSQTGPTATGGLPGGNRATALPSAPGQHARRIRRLKANSNLKTAEALYLNRWQRKVESVGTLYFSSELADKRGRLTVLVVLEPSGRVRGIRIVEPSPNQALNEAVINIVQASSPFPPFPDEIAEEVDLLEVVRVWVFAGRGQGTIALPPIPDRDRP